MRSFLGLLRNNTKPLSRLSKTASVETRPEVETRPTTAIAATVSPEKYEKQYTKPMQICTTCELAVQNHRIAYVIAPTKKSIMPISR